MNKGELVAALAAKTEMTKKESEAALNGIIDVIAESMAKGEKVQLIGFGTFEALRHLRSQESSGSRGPQSPHRRFREDRCLQGPRFQSRQGPEGRCEQEEEVISVHTKNREIRLTVFFCPDYMSFSRWYCVPRIWRPSFASSRQGSVCIPG